VGTTPLPNKCLQHPTVESFGPQVVSYRLARLERKVYLCSNVTSMVRCTSKLCEPFERMIQCKIEICIVAQTLSLASLKRVRTLEVAKYFFPAPFPL